MVRCKIVLQRIKRVHCSHTQQYVVLQKDSVLGLFPAAGTLTIEDILEFHAFWNYSAKARGKKKRPFSLIEKSKFSASEPLILQSRKSPHRTNVRCMCESV